MLHLIETEDRRELPDNSANLGSACQRVDLEPRSYPFELLGQGWGQDAFQHCQHDVARYSNLRQLRRVSSRHPLSDNKMLENKVRWHGNELTCIKYWITELHATREDSRIPHQEKRGRRSCSGSTTWTSTSLWCPMPSWTIYSRAFSRNFLSTTALESTKSRHRPEKTPIVPYSSRFLRSIRLARKFLRFFK